MACKYENKINEAFFIAGRDGRNVNRELLAELQEVYRKARAFDEILNLPDTYGYAEEYAEDVDIILSEYMEDE